MMVKIQMEEKGDLKRSLPTGRQQATLRTFSSRPTYLYFFYYLFPKGAHFGGTGNCHVFRALILTAHTIKGPGVVLDIAV